MQDDLSDVAHLPSTTTGQDKNFVKKGCSTISDCLLYPIVFCMCCACWCSYGCPHPQKWGQNIDTIVCNI